MNLEQKKHFDDFGYVIIPNILTKDKCNYYINEIWKWLENLNIGIKRDDKKTHFNDLCQLHGIVKDYKSGHSKFMWDIRCEKNVLKIFEDFFGDNNLLVSYDVFTILKNSKERKGTKHWLHVDQNPKNKNFYTIQGLVNLEDCKETDATFQCYPKSHLYFLDLFKDEKMKGDWFRMDETQLNILKDKDLQLKRLKLNKGDVLLWDSRLVHSNVRASVRHKKYYRYVTYVSYAPRKLASDFQLKKKRRSFMDMRNTSHNAWRCMLNNKFSRWNKHKDDENLKLQEEPVDLGKYKYLAGF